MGLRGFSNGEVHQGLGFGGAPVPAGTTTPAAGNTASAGGEADATRSEDGANADSDDDDLDEAGAGPGTKLKIDTAFFRMAATKRCGMKGKKKKKLGAGSTPQAQKTKKSKAVEPPDATVPFLRTDPARRNLIDDVSAAAVTSGILTTRSTSQRDGALYI